MVSDPSFVHIAFGKFVITIQPCSALLCIANDILESVLLDWLQAHMQKVQAMVYSGQA